MKIKFVCITLTAVCLAIGIPVADAQTYDSNTTVYIDALFCRAHAADCPALILKEQKQTMTLEEADQLGYRIGESGQSGRVEDDCCLLGYDAVRKYPKATIANNALGVAEVMDGGVLKYHVHGCHRFTPDRDDYRMTKAQVLATPGGYVCEHCIERGPGFAQMTQEEWDKLPSHAPWVPPAGWAPSPFPTNSYPQQNKINMLLSEVLHGDIAIQESVYINPVATVDHFMIMRFFFPVERWLELYQAYRCTGDTNVLEQLRGSARNYNTLSTNYLSAAQLKAKDPEGMAYMYTMAASARITLQLALKYPSQVTAGELAEAEEFLTTIISVLQPTCEGSSNLDPQMGIPQPLADDFRTRAFNRALNGIGTIGMTVAALEDLQVLNSTTAYQSTIDRYRLIIQQYIINWKNTGFAETYNGDDYFSYPYSATDSGYWVGDVKLFGAEDQGHFSHSMQGCYVLYDSVPELGVDDAFMTALANTIEFNSYTTSGSPQTPSQEAIRPYSRQPFALPSDRFYLLQAFNAGVIGGQCSKLSALGADSLNSQYLYRLATFNAQYLKERSQDQTLIHMGEESVAPPAPPTGLSGTGSDGSVSLDWADNSEGDMVSGTYTVYRSTTSGSGYLLIASNLTSSAYIDNAVTNDTMYYYVVTATDTNSDVSATSSEFSVAPYIPNATLPAAPTNLTAAVSDSIVSLNWADNSESDLNCYNIYRSTTSSNYTEAPVNVRASELDDTNVVNGTTYYYVVTAVDHSGNESVQSAEIFATPEVYGPTITFGSNHDGYGGFGSSAATGTEVWSLAADSVNYEFGLSATDESHTASLLKSYSLDRSDGTTYTIEGVVDLTDGYGDDNNRIGLLLFNSTPTQTADGGGGLFLRLNADDNQDVAIENGIAGSKFSTTSTGVNPGDLWIGQTLTFKADLIFTNVAGTDKINVALTLTDGALNAYSTSAQVDAAGYTGTYCGFATKWRQRGVAPTQNTPPVIDYRSFMVSNHAAVVTDTTPPAAPTGLNATAGDDYVSLNWADNGESDLASYSVYRSNVSNSYGGALATNIFSSAYVDYTAVNGNTYYYVVTATDTNGNESAKSIEESAAPVAPNTPPTADAGIDQNVTDSDDNGSESVTLNGSGSSDPDGTIVSYVWTEGGSQIATGVSPSVSLAVGVHTITLTVTDDESATDIDTVTVTVNAAPVNGSLVSYDFGSGAGQDTIASAGLTTYIQTGTSNAVTDQTDAIALDNLIETGSDSAAGFYRSFAGLGPDSTNDFVITMTLTHPTVNFNEPDIGIHLFGDTASSSYWNTGIYASAEKDRHNSPLSELEIRNGGVNGSLLQSGTIVKDLQSLETTVEVAGTYGTYGSDNLQLVLTVSADGLTNSITTTVNTTGFSPTQTGFGVSMLADNNNRYLVDTFSVGIETVAAPDTTPPAVPEGLSALAGIGEVDLDWDDNSEPDLAGYTVYRSTASGSGYTAIATNVAVSAYLDDTVANNTVYYYKVTASDTNGNESAQSEYVSAQPGWVANLVVTNTVVTGSVSGTLADIDLSDDTYQTITETVSGNTSALEHKWVFNVTAAELVTVYLEAHHSSNSEGDDFIFAYSTDDVNYTDIITVTKTSDDDTVQWASLPGSPSGTLTIRVLDADRTDGNTQLDSIYIDNLFIVSEESSTAPTATTAPAPADTATDVAVDADLSWTAGMMAASHDVYFGTSPSPAFQTNQTGSVFDPGTLANDTTYYWSIDEVNNSGTTTGSVWSFTTAALQSNPPQYVEAGGIAGGTGTVAPSLPSGIATDDILLLFVETANQAVSVSNPNGGTWTEVTGSPQGTGTAGGTSATRLTAFWSRYNGTQGNPTVSDSGNHQIARIIAIRGAVASGNPWDVTSGGVEATADTSGAIAGATTTVNNTLVVTAVATSLPDANGTANFSGWANSDLTGVAERTDDTNKANNGGGLGIATGVKATAGSYGSTTVTCGSSAVKGMMSIAIKP